MQKTYDETEIRQDYRRLTQYLIEKGITITTMESATSGQIASLITDTEGASAILKGAFITYSNEAKILQGVPGEIIEKYSVYSEETAKAMANCCKRRYNADIGIGVTGTMGNIDPENPEASTVGDVYFSIAMEESVRSYHVHVAPQKCRLQYKLAVAKEVYDKLKYIFDNSGSDT